MTDPAIQFQGAGFDSPEMAQQIAQAFEDVRAAFQQFAQACAQIMAEIVEFITPIVRAFARWIRSLPFLRRIVPPRNTIMRRKIRHYYMQARK